MTTTHRYLVLGPCNLWFGYSHSRALQVDKCSPVYHPIGGAVDYLSRGYKEHNTVLINVNILAVVDHDACMHATMERSSQDWIHARCGTYGFN